MNSPIERIGQHLFPEKIRRYLTFRLMTVFVVLLFLVNFALNVLNEPEPYSDVALRLSKIRGLVHLPIYLIFQNVGLALGFWLVYATREKKQYYWLRVVFYGMLIGGLLGEIVSFLLPIHQPWWNSR